MTRQHPDDPLRTCVRCIMDTSDPDIVFDEAGVCNHCRRAETLLPTVHFTPEQSEARLRAIAERIKAASRGRYDSLIGLSGGVDSSYVAYVAHRLGLRPLAVHFDNGWNSEIAVANIEKIVRKCGFDLITYVIDWREFRDLQRAFLRASVIDVEMLTDHAIIAAMYKIAAQHDIKFILSGTNYATEHGMPRSWLWNKQDLRNIRAIHRRYGELKLKSFPMMSTARYVFNRFIRDYRYVELLNNLNYSKTEAIVTLEREFGWTYYGGKHYESVFTKFYQAYILPAKFGVDKRKVHFSDLLRNGEITRDEALEEMNKPLYRPDELEQEKQYVIEKLGFSESEFDAIMKTPPRSHRDFPSDEWLVNIMRRVRSLAR
jgi:N-acetyl sugar amidotransferase